VRAADRILAGLCTFFMHPPGILRSPIVLKPSTLLHLTKLPKRRKYGPLFSPKRVRLPRPNGPRKEFIDAVVE
jgi:hypothetical protein